MIEARPPNNRTNVWFEAGAVYDLKAAGKWFDAGREAGPMDTKTEAFFRARSGGGVGWQAATGLLG